MEGDSSVSDELVVSSDKKKTAPVCTSVRNPSWWKRRTRMERTLTLLSAIALIIAIALLIGLIIVLCQQKNEQSHDVCLTPGCIQAATRIMDAMDTSVDPCDDFYQYTCGNFVKKTNIPDDKAAVTSFSIIGDELREQLKTMIEEPVQKDEPKPFQLVKKLYKACMNKTAIEADGLRGIKEIMRKLGGWPVMDYNWNERNFNWMKATYNFRKIGLDVNYFISFSVSVDFKNSSRRIGEIDQPALGLGSEFLAKGLDDKLVKAYYDYMVDIAVIFGANRDRAADEMKKALIFEMKLANISVPQEQLRDPTAQYNPMTVRQLQNRYPRIRWLEYFNTFLAPDNVIGEDEVIIVKVPSYFTSFMDLIEKTPKRTQANYMSWRAAHESISYLTEELRDRQLQYSTIVTGSTKREPRWKECMDVVSGGLSFAVGALYVRKYFNEDARQTALGIVTDIRTEFRKIVENVDWMDEKTRQNALDKADTMTAHIAYPDELLDDKKIEEFYKDLELNEFNYLQSLLNVSKFETQYVFSRLRIPVNKTEWVTHGTPAIVNAFYASFENSIQFPAGILQGVFFNNDFPKYMNYGGIGFVIGHEITHGFDDEGRQFDKDGNLVDWWAEDTKKAFEKKAQCFIDQYSSYSVPELGMNLNGINTQGENIADNGGIKEAYLGYQQWVKKNGPELPLPGLNLTAEQLFWVSAASAWCSKSRMEELKQDIITDEHSPNNFRVLGAFSNMEDFAKDFNCPPNSKMNPTHKCKIW